MLVSSRVCTVAQPRCLLLDLVLVLLVIQESIIVVESCTSLVTRGVESMVSLVTDSVEGLRSLSEGEDS